MSEIVAVSPVRKGLVALFVGDDHDDYWTRPVVAAVIVRDWEAPGRSFDSASLALIDSHNGTLVPCSEEEPDWVGPVEEAEEQVSHILEYRRYQEIRERAVKKS